MGGGSSIDAGKAIAILATNGGEPLEFLETVGKGRAFTVPPLAFIAVPTTAGTGSEVTRNAVLGSTEHGVKASLRSPLMLPRVAVVDPEHAATVSAFHATEHMLPARAQCSFARKAAVRTTGFRHRRPRSARAIDNRAAPG
ncbi:iron-containing alcohol dehydrogenase [Lacticaseibacillus rhamnosus]